MTFSIDSSMLSSITSNLTEGIMQESKVQQTRVRRIAERQGLALQVSRRRDPRARDYGQVWLRWLDAPTPERSNDAWIGPFDSLDDVELVLTTDEDKLPPDFEDVKNIDNYFASRRG